MRCVQTLLLLVLTSGVASAQGTPGGGAAARTVTLKKGDRIHFWGDSLTEQALTPKGWVTLVQEHFKKSHPDLDIEVVTAAGSGYPIVSRLGNYKRDVLAKKATVIVIQGGVGDLFRKVSDDDFKAALEGLVERSRQEGIRIVLCSCTSLGEKKDGGNSNDKRLDELAEIARQVARNKKVPLNDLRKAFKEYWSANNPKNRENGILTNDGNHFNDTGNQFVAERMLEMFTTPKGEPVKPPVKAKVKKTPIILDCDIGTDIDDTFAVALAAISPDLDLRGVTTVSGDTQARALMVCRLLTAAGLRDVPVARGKADQPPQPLRGMQEQYIRQPPAFRASQPIKESAVEFMYRRLKANPGEITLVAVGPLSNIAQLLSEHPDCKPWIKRLVIMGGSVRVGYNNKPPINAEFNIRADAKAAQAVFSAGLPLVVAPLDATTMLKLEEPGLKQIFAAGTLVNGHVQSLYQLWDQKADPILFDPVAVTLVFNEQFCKMEDLHLEVDDKGFTRIGTGKANARVATSIRADDYLKWFVDRFAVTTEAPIPMKPVNVSKTIDRKGMPNRVHVFEDYETDIEKRWWLSGKAHATEVLDTGKRVCRAVLTQDFDGQMGDQKRMYSAVIFNPVPGPPMGKNPRLSFRYFLKGTGVLKVQIYSLSNNYHRFLTLTGLPEGRWQEATVDMTAARKADGTGGPLSEGERIDDIQFYADPRAELMIDNIVLYDEAGADEKRAFPRLIIDDLLLYEPEGR